MKKYTGMLAMCLYALVIGFLVTPEVDAKPGNEKMEKAKNQLEPALKVFDQHLLEGRLEEGKKILLGAIPEGQSNEYHDYLLGNVLYSIDPVLSYRLHRQAYEQNPQEPAFLFEYGIELHRHREFEKAIGVYKALVSLAPREEQVNALIADALINLDQPAEAVAYWKKAYHHSNQPAIDLAIYHLYGNEDAIVKRARLLREAQQQPDVFEELILLDLSWPVDWWKQKTHRTYLSYDLGQAANRLGKDSKKYRQLETLIELIERHQDLYASVDSAGNFSAEYLKNYQLREAQAKDFLHSKLREPGWIVDRAELPSNSKVAAWVVDMSITVQLFTPSELLDRFGGELLERAKKSRDRDALNMYAFLYQAVEGTGSPEVDLMGWKELGDQRFAESYFLSLRDIPAGDAELLSAIAQFPDSAQLRWIAMNAAREENKPLKTYLKELVRTEFKTLQTDEQRYSYQLNSYFYLLGKQ